ncbi:MAG TPA: hypothetical protein ENL02_00485 [Epsilonproteobacteria bacterium]|nr:hypothetical protein [Campylobacterota bacterium]
MNNTAPQSNYPAPLVPANYSFVTLNDEVRADQLCKELLELYHQFLLKNKSISAREAGTLASGADYFLRDYMLDNLRTNPFKISPDLIRRFAGNWYIISTLEPNAVELQEILAGVSYFAEFCVANRMIEQPLATEIERICSDMEFYRQRIDSFNDLSGDNFAAWNNDCP